MVFFFEVLISIIENSFSGGIVNNFSPANAASCFFDKPSFRPCHETDKLRARFLILIFWIKNFHTFPDEPCSHCIAQDLLKKPPAFAATQCRMVSAVTGISVVMLPLSEYASSY